MAVHLVPACTMRMLIEYITCIHTRVSFKFERNWRENCNGVQQKKKVVHVLKEGIPLAAASSSKTGQSLIPDPGVKLSSCRPSSHSFLPGPEIILNVIPCQALAHTLYDLLNYFTITLVLMFFLKISSKGKFIGVSLVIIIL